MKLSGHCGADVCSPGELLFARQAGFHENEITYTGTSVSDEDIECLKRHPGVRVNGGFNIQNLAAYYQTPFIVTPLKWKPDTPREKITLAGNINEAIDILAEDIALPAVSEGDYLALLNTGGYGSASSSNHRMRRRFSEYLLIDGYMNGLGMQFV